MPNCWNAGGDRGEDYSIAQDIALPLHIIVANPNTVFYSGQNQFLMNDGTGSFTSATLPEGAGTTESVAVADMNGDGLLDIIFGMSMCFNIMLL